MDEFPLAVTGFDYALIAVGLAWVAIFAMLAGGMVVELLRMTRRQEKTPFFLRLERHGVSLIQAEQQAGFRSLGDMARRCTSCSTRKACRRALRWGWLGYAAPPCPNAAFFSRFGGSAP